MPEPNPATTPSDNANEPSVLRKSSLIIAAQLLSTALRFGSNIILAWLLVPEAFGIAAIVGTVLTGLALLSDVGIGDSIVRNAKGEQPEFYYSAYAIQVVRGFILYAVLFASAGYVADFYNEEILEAALKIGGISLLLYGFGSTRYFLLQRNQQIKTQVVVDIVVQILGTLIVLAICVYEPTVWALIYANIINAALYLAASFYVTPFPLRTHRFTVVPQYLREIFGFGKWIFFSTLFHFVIIQSDKLFVGKLASVEELGLYALATALATIVLWFASSLTEKIVYPSLSEAARNNMASFGERLVETLRQILPILLIMSLAVVAISPLFFAYLYKTEYAPAGEIAQALAVMVWFMAIYDMFQKVAISFGKPEVGALAAFISAISRVALSLVGYHYHGLDGFIFGLTLGSIAGLGFLYLWLASNSIKHRYIELIYSIILLAAYFSKDLIELWSPTNHHWVHFVLVGTLATAFFVRQYAEHIRRYLPRANATQSA
ncbi:MAG: oligosaccharide flippase family protein [Thiotrichales bacterium]